MKAQIRKVVRKVALWPIVGRFVRIGVAVIRLPEFRAEYLARNGQGAPISHSTSQLLANLDHRALFESQQLPTLLQALADVNHRQLTSDNDRANLVNSVPVALRTFARDLHQLQEAVKKVEKETEALQAVRQELAEQQARSAAFGQQLDATAQAMTTGLTEQQERSTALAQQIDAAAQSVKDVEAEGRGDIATLKESVGYLLGRVEFVRRELMFEMRYGASSPAGGEDALKAETQILSVDKLEAARLDKVRLNLGCGHVALDGYLNVDRRALPGVDIVAEVDQLPFGPGEVDEIFSSHLLEHFPQEQLMRQLLPYYRSLLKAGGQIHAVVPDAEAMIRAYSNGGYPYDDMREVLYGGQDYDGDFHFNMFTPAALSQLLIEAGFVNPTVIAAGRKNGRCYEFEISAEKTSIA